MAKDAYTTFIYALIDPVSSEVRYVGKADNPEKRYKAHLHSNYNNTKKECWIKSLKNNILKPSLVILEEIAEENWQECEKKWISHYKNLGVKLVNGTEGGDGGRISPEIMRIVSIKRTGVKINRKCFTNSNNGRPLTEKHRKAISKAKTGSRRSDKHNYIKQSKLFSKQLFQFDMDENFIREWPSLKEVEKQLGIRNGNISNVCSGRSKSAGGFKWAFEKVGALK